jgi:hypothetical protein
VNNTIFAQIGLVGMRDFSTGCSQVCRFYLLGGQLNSSSIA